MKYQVRNGQGKLIGFLVGNTYIPKKHISFYISDLGGVLPTKFAKPLGSGIVLDGTEYQSIGQRLKQTSVEELKSELEQEGVSLRDVWFIEDFKNDGYSFQEMCTSDFIKHHHTYTVKSTVDENEAILFSNDDLYNCGFSFNISALEVRNKGQGFGTLVIDNLKSLVKTIEGVSLVNARDFWEKQGADFIDDIFVIICK